jgi:hypothetical protein
VGLFHRGLAELPPQGLHQLYVRTRGWHESIVAADPRQNAGSSPETKGDRLEVNLECPRHEKSTWAHGPTVCAAEPLEDRFRMYLRDAKAEFSMEGDAAVYT